MLGRADPSRLAAQVGGGAPLQCPTDIAQCCGDDGNIFWVSRDPAANCQFPQCNRDLTACAGDLNTCVRAGCNGSQCVPRREVTASGWCGVDPKAACYDMGTCGAKPSGGCGWLPNPAFDECMNDNTAGTCPTDASCLTRAACGDSGGTAGNACGADDTNVCCSGGDTQPDGPVEECDDGNQIDDDACGNDCEINCAKNSDCPEGACVNGKCVDQCVEPEAECGNGDVEAGEQCDDGNLDPGDTCDPTCKIPCGAPGGECATCGNGNVEAGEQCDDGNTSGDDGCGATCQLNNCPVHHAGVTCTAGTACPAGAQPEIGLCSGGVCCKSNGPSGSVPVDFLSRLMAQQLPRSFKLLP